jgi:aspartate-semialdehyde dehydrogenase
MDRQRACILGATGAAGQNIVESLVDHPWFEIDALAASSRSQGKRYRDAIEGAVFFEKHPPDHVLGMIVENVEKINPRDYDLAFSALPSSVAKEIEARFAEHIPVFSTASAYRYEEDVPVLIPDRGRTGAGKAMSAPAPTAPLWGSSSPSSRSWMLSESRR